MPLTTEVYPEPINNQIDDVEDEDSSSEEESERFGFWGAGSGSSSSLSKYMAKREKEAAKELKKQIIKRDLELKRENSKKDVVAEPKKETTYVKEPVNVPAPQAPEVPKMNSSGSGDFSRALSNSRSDVNQAALRQSQDLNNVRREDNDSRSLQNIARNGDVRSSRDESLSFSEEYVNRGQPVHNEPSGYSNGYNAQHQAPISSLQREFLQREFFDAEPELPDSISAAKVMRRIGAYRNWSEREIQADLNALEYHRLRTIKDMRDLSSDGWKEIKELLPLVKDLLIKEISRGRSSPVNRGGDIQQQAGNFQGAYNAASEQSTSTFDLKNIKAPTSTPMDTPDFSANRRAFQPRNTAW